MLSFSLLLFVRHARHCRKDRRSNPEPTLPHSELLDVGAQVAGFDSGLQDIYLPLHGHPGLCLSESLTYLVMDLDLQVADELIDVFSPIVPTMARWPKKLSMQRATQEIVSATRHHLFQNSQSI